MDYRVLIVNSMGSPTTMSAPRLRNSSLIISVHVTSLPTDLEFGLGRRTRCKGTAKRKCRK